MAKKIKLSKNWAKGIDKIVVKINPKNLVKIEDCDCDRCEAPKPQEKARLVKWPHGIEMAEPKEVKPQEKVLFGTVKKGALKGYTEIYSADRKSQEKEGDWEKRFRLRLWNIYATYFQICNENYDSPILKEKANVIIGDVRQLLAEAKKEGYIEGLNIQSIDLNIFRQEERAKTIKEIGSITITNPYKIKELGRLEVIKEIEEWAKKNRFIYFGVLLVEYKKLLKKLSEIKKV